MTVFRPSARVDLRIRTEEFDDTEALERRLSSPTERTAYAPPPDPVAPATTRRNRLQARLRSNQAARRQLERGLRDGSVMFGDFILQLAELDSARLGLQQQIGVADRRVANALQEVAQRPRSFAAPSDELSAIGNIQPIHVQIERNGLTSADTCTITLDYTDAPFDPRVIRSAGVEVTLGVVPAENFEAGAEQGTRREDGSLVSIVARQVDGSLVGATRFVGFVDDWSVKYSESGDTVTLECRDMSAQLRDLRLNPGESINMDIPLDQGVQLFFDQVSAVTAGIVVRFVGEGSAPVPADALPVTMRARRGRVARRGRRGDQDMSVWDHVTDVCRSVGFVPVVRDFEVIIAEARTLFSTEGVRRMIYGRNVEELNFTRRLQGTKVPTIEVRSYDPDLGRTRWARFPVRAGERDAGVFGVDNPPRALRASEVPPSGANPAESIQVVQVSGIVDPAVLRRVAQNTFEQLGRQEIEGTLSTHDVHSYDRPPDEADLLSAQAGDPIEVLIVAAPGPELAEASPNTTLAQLQAMSRTRREQYLLGLGWGREIAARFAALQEATAFQTVFLTQDVRISWDHEQGNRIVIGFVNYVTVREDAQ